MYFRTQEIYSKLVLKVCICMYTCMYTLKYGFYVAILYFIQLLSLVSSSVASYLDHLKSSDALFNFGLLKVYSEWSIKSFVEKCYTGS